MPIKEIIAFSGVIMISIMITHPTRPLKAVRAMQLKILREVGRTDNWGNPSIFQKPKKTSKSRQQIEPAS